MSNIIELINAAGLTGRGGAAFPSAIKIKAAKENKARLIVNVCDGEIGAAKDGWVVANHLNELLEGVALITSGHAKPLFAAHRDSTTAKLLAAAGLKVLEVPHRYVSSEETSLISLAHGGTARPMTKKAPFVFGGQRSDGKRIRPTVVLNAESVWRVSQISRRGVDWFRSYGTDAEPGPRLVAVGGFVSTPSIIEAAAGIPLMELINLAGGLDPSVRFVGVGGLGGILLTAAEARSAVWDTPTMKRYGGGLGPGIITVWDPRQAAAHTAGAMIAYGAGESAGQCGPCMFGLPALSADWNAFAMHPSPDSHQRLQNRLTLFERRGACAHPDGVSRFATSALRVLGPELLQSQPYFAGGNQPTEVLSYV